MSQIGLIRPMRRDDKLRRRATGDVRLKNFVRVVQVRDDDVEPGKVIRKVRGELAIPSEETGEAPRLDGLHPVHQSAGQRQLDDMRVTKHFQMRLRKLPAESRDGGQRENEIANRPATNDEDSAFG